MPSNIELIVVKNAMAYGCDNTDCQVLTGDDLFELVRSVYPSGQPLNTYWYYEKWDTDSDVTPECADDINALNERGGTIYVVTYPADPVTAAIVAVSVLVSVAVTFFVIPTPTVAGAPTAPPSPNNALAQRTNRQRLGGRVPAIFGEVWSVPDLTQPPYSVYIDHEEIEYSSMCLGEGWYDVIQAKDDNTNIGLISGANARIYNPNVSTLFDEPSVEFGNPLTPKEQDFDHFTARRYSSVNGQVLSRPENYIIGNNNIVFEVPNKVRIVSGSAAFSASKYAIGETLNVEADDEKLVVAGQADRYISMSGFYEIIGRTDKELILNNPEMINTAWVTLANSSGSIAAGNAVLSVESRPLWQGWHYIRETASRPLMNFIAPQGIYTTHQDGDKFAAFDINLLAEIQVLDANGEPSTRDTTVSTFPIFGRTAKLNSAGTEYTFTTSDEARQTAALTKIVWPNDRDHGFRVRVRRNSFKQALGSQFMVDDVKWADLYSITTQKTGPTGRNERSTLVKTKTKATAGATALKERKLSVLARRKTKGLTPWSGKITDMYVNDDSRLVLQLTSEVDFEGLEQGVILIKAKTEIIKKAAYLLFSGGAISKHHVVLPVMTAVEIQTLMSSAPIGSDYYFILGDPSTSNAPYFDYNYLGQQGMSRLERIYSNRIDDIIYHIATSDTTGNLTPNDLNMVQITAEVDAQIEYFGTDLCAQFCGTFDSADISTEEMIQTVASAGFFTAYRINNKIHLHFERPESLPVATFNSHNILPDTFEYSESFGPRNNYDGVEVTWTDPKNDAKATLSYPPYNSAINPQKIELVGVRNKVQAHMHMMRAHHKNQNAYRTCSFTGADESGVVIPTNRINVANQLRADTQQGEVESLQINNSGQTVMVLSDDVDFGTKTQATIFVQTVSATVDNITCMPSAQSNEVILSRPPNQPLSTAWDAVVRATYQLVLHDDLDRDSYIVTAKEPGENSLSHRLTCINYSARYYPNDNDFKRGAIA